MPCVPVCAFRPRLELLEGRTLLAAGALDPTFGSGGKVLTEFPGRTASVAEAIVGQPDGKLIAVGRTDQSLGMVRYNADGSLDGTLGSGGRVVAEFGGPTAGYAAALQPDGKIVVAGV